MGCTAFGPGVWFFVVFLVAAHIMLLFCAFNEPLVGIPALAISGTMDYFSFKGEFQERVGEIRSS